MNKLLLLACMMGNSFLLSNNVKEGVTLGRPEYAHAITNAFGCKVELPGKSLSVSKATSNQTTESFCNEHRGKIGFAAGAATATATIACIFFYWLSQTAK